VRTQIKQIYMRLGVRSQLELAAHVNGSRDASRE
jgi:DNA-binding CsgD family transcriptional regulator